MKILGSVVIALIGAAVVYAIFTGTSPADLSQEGSDRTQSEEMSVDTFVSPYGYSYTYPVGAQGYTAVIQEEAVAGDRVFVQSIFQTSDYDARISADAPQEAPPSLAIEVYRNPMNLNVEEWIQQHENSNYALNTNGSISTVSLGGTNFAKYQYDGLYRSDAYAFAQEGYIYLFSNMWMDAESKQKQDMEALLQTLSWSEPSISAAVAHGDIKVTSLQRGQEIDSPLIVEGEARGSWFFEASFPIILVNWDGLILAEGFAQAQSEWMTNDFVPFTGEVVFTTPEYGERGAVILQKANASGLPEHADAIEIPVVFKQ